jgi:PleD family two-component response regulator
MIVKILSTGYMVAECLRQGINSAGFAYGQVICVIASLGAGVLSGKHDDFDVVWERANRAHYQAKHAGRN